MYYLLKDNFDDGVLSPKWSTYSSTQADFAEVGGTLQITAAGTDIWVDNDEYAAVYHTPPRDSTSYLDATVKVVGQDFTSDWAKAGIAVRFNMARSASATDYGSPGYVCLVVTPDGKCALQWDDWISHCKVADLRYNADFPDRPSGSETITSFKAPTDWDDCYGQRISGLIQPPTTGEYAFQIASDDNSELWLSSTQDPADKRLIASVPGWNYPDEYDYYPSQESSVILLKAGKKHYIEALHKEGWGGDNLTVRWKGPGLKWQVIQGTFLREWWNWKTQWPDKDGFLDSNVNTKPGTVTFPCWLKLEKWYRSFAGYYSNVGPDGPWEFVGSADVVVYSDPLHCAQGKEDVGLIVCSHNPDVPGRAVFDDFLLNPSSEPPAPWITVEPKVLWPPNHKMVEITAISSLSDYTDSPVRVSLVDAWMNEADTYDPAYDATPGDGQTTGDIRIEPDGRVFLRAERSAMSEGRKYLLTYVGRPDCGYPAWGSVIVFVPHDQGQPYVSKNDFGSTP
jgi:hypothetical protein